MMPDASRFRLVPLKQEWRLAGGIDVLASSFFL